MKYYKKELAIMIFSPLFEHDVPEVVLP